MKSLRELLVVKTVDTSNYLLSYARDPNTGYSEIILESKTAGHHRARHDSVDILDDHGALIYTAKIDEKIAHFVLDNFNVFGDTQSFRIFQSDLHLGFASNRDDLTVNPLEVRHQLTEQEKSFTANGAKLVYHKSIFNKYAQTGFGSIIRATLTNHQVCASNCQFCSTISRNRKDSITLQEAKDFVDQLYFDQAEYNRKFFPEFNEAYKKETGSDIRLRGLILSGGGQPNLWPHFTEFVDYLSSLDISLGLITNGFPQKVPEYIYKKFEWIRISITPESASPFYPGGRFDKQYMPQTIKHNSDITVGYSYVFGPWTNDGILNRIASSIEENGFQYCRTLTDCNLTRNAQLKAHRDLAERLFKLNHIDEKGNPVGKIFHQLKYHGSKLEAENLWDDGQCFLQTYNLFWDTTGHEENGYSYCYPCDSVTVLAEIDTDGSVNASERKFNPEKWGTVKNTEVSRLFTEQVKPFFDPRKICTSCLFMKNNQMVKDLVNKPNNQLFSEFQSLEHINFP
jgi:hypothetical protein